MSGEMRTRDTAHQVPAGITPTRLDAYAAEVFEEINSRAQGRKLARDGAILLNGAAAESARFVKPGDSITLRFPLVSRAPAYRHPIEVVHLDPWVAVVVKPAGMPVRANQHRTLEHAIKHNVPRSEVNDALPAAAPVHRLDNRTSGLVIAARSATALTALSQAFAARKIHKRYRAVVVGELKGEGTIDRPVGGREAISRYRTLSHVPSLHCGQLTLVDLWPLTGRTHQLRQHVAHLGHPVLGDDLYTEGKVLRGSGLFLCAVALSFTHPESGRELQIEIDPPPKFQAFMDREARRVARHAGPGQTMDA